MGVPFEALLPYGVILGMFTATGLGLAAVKKYTNDGKRPRRALDAWDRQSIFEAPSQATLTDQDSVIDRDMRLTGKFRAQTDHPEAPLGFEVNNPWKLEDRIK